MNKYFILIICLTLLVGCTLGNTPTARVEEMLSNYQRLDKSINISYTNITDDTNISNDLKDRYEELIKKQYKNLSYEVKDEEIDGDTAVVTISVEVMDYKEEINKFNKEEYDLNNYHDHVLDALRDTDDKAVYTLEISLTKDKNDTWVVDDLTKESRDKLLGIY